jgi:cell division protein FtsB
MQDQISLTPEAVIAAQNAVIGELQGKVIALSAAVNVLSAENRSLKEQVASLQDDDEKSDDKE